LGYLAKTDLYGEPLASFPVILDPNINVALAADFQGIYEPDWAVVSHTDEVWQIYTRNYLRGMEVVDSVDVADLTSEKVHNYHWRDGERLPGFPTEVYQQRYLDCLLDDERGLCRLLDGGRRINGEESFTLHTRPDQDLVLVTRLHPFNAGTFDVYANEVLMGTRVIPALPGSWLEVQTLIPKTAVTGKTLNIRIAPHTPGGHYIPYYHWVYQSGDYQANEPYQAPEVTFQDGAIELIDHSYAISESVDGRVELEISLFWYTGGGARGDYVTFVHVYNAQDEIVAQADQRPGLGTLPPGNWLPGMFRDSVVVNLTEVPAGQYHVAVGLYDPITLTRLAPSGGDEQQRYFLDDLELPNYD